MPDFLLRKIKTHPFDQNSYDVILTLEDGYELQVGAVRKDVGAWLREFWAWCAPGSHGQAETREAAMAAFRAAWTATRRF